MHHNDNKDRATPSAESADITLRSGRVFVRPATRELSVDGEPVSIERRAFDLLVHLMRNADRVVDKDELLHAVWRDRPVSESTIAQSVSRVRKALGGDTEEWVATVYGVGYRFTGSVTMLDHRAPKTDNPQVKSPGRALQPRWIAVLGLVTVALVVLLTTWIRGQQPLQTQLRVAVLPVQNETGDARLDWVELGVLPLIDQALEEGGLQRVATQQVVSTLRRYPQAQDSEAQARVLRLNAQVDRVLVPRLYLAEGGYRFEMRSADSDDGVTDRYDLDLQGADIPVLAVAAGTTLSESLSRWQGAKRARSTLVTDDPFVNQAFARGLDARLRGQWEDAARFFDTVLTTAPDLLAAKYHLALVTRRLGDWDYTEQLHAELLQAAEAQENISMQAAVQSTSGTLAWRRGQRDKAEAWYLKALAHYRTLNHADYIANTMANLGILAATRGEYDLAEQRFQEALQHFSAVGDQYNKATALKNLGQLFVDQGRLQEASDQLQQSLEIRRTLELPHQVALTLSSIADIDMARGNWATALAKYERVVEIADEYDSPTLKAQAKADLSSVLRRLGRLDAARRAAAEAHRIATELGSPANQAFALLQQGRVEFDLGHWLRAAELFLKAQSLYTDIDQPLGEEQARIARAEALIELNQWEEAATLLNKVDARLQASQLKRLTPDLKHARAKLAMQQGDLESAIALQRQAFQMVKAHESPIQQLDHGGELGLLLLKSAADENTLNALARQLTPRAEVSTSALHFLARYYHNREPDRALQWAQRRQTLKGEAWTPADERELQNLRTATQQHPDSTQ